MRNRERASTDLLAIGAWSCLLKPPLGRSLRQRPIKPSISESILNVRPLPGRLTADASLQILIQYAYGIQPFQVVGGPSWLHRSAIKSKPRPMAIPAATKCFSCCNRCWKTTSD